MSKSRDWPGTGRLAGTSLWERVVNGPVRSRRLGVSLGLNIIPARSKLCSFDCPYCECGFNTPRAAGEKWPAPDVVADALRKTLTHLAVRPDWVTFAGNGEPTMHPRFAVVVDRVLEARDEVSPGLRVGVLSNGMHLGSAPVVNALNRLDARMMKLDPGPAAIVNGRDIDTRALAASYRLLTQPVIQAMVVEGAGWSGDAAGAVDEWLRLLELTGAAAVHIYSLDRAPADVAVRAVARERLEVVAARAREVVAGPVLVF